MRRHTSDCASKLAVNGNSLRRVPSRLVPNTWCHIHQMWTTAQSIPFDRVFRLALPVHLPDLRTTASERLEGPIVWMPSHLRPV